MVGFLSSKIMLGFFIWREMPLNLALKCWLKLVLITSFKLIFKKAKQDLVFKKSGWLKLSLKNPLKLSLARLTFKLV